MCVYLNIHILLQNTCKVHKRICRNISKNINLKKMLNHLSPKSSVVMHSYIHSFMRKHIFLSYSTRLRIPKRKETVLLLQCLQSQLRNQECSQIIRMWCSMEESHQIETEGYGILKKRIHFQLGGWHVLQPDAKGQSEKEDRTRMHLSQQFTALSKKLQRKGIPGGGRQIRKGAEERWHWVYSESGKQLIQSEARTRKLQKRHESYPYGVWMWRMARVKDYTDFKLPQPRLR